MATVTSGRATDFITFSRTSNATVTAADGKIKWAGHNLLTNSESFDASAWNKVGATVTANAVAAPNGATTADEIAFTTTSATVARLTGNFPSVVAGASYTHGVWLRAKTGTFKLKVSRTDTTTWTTATVSSEITLTTDWQYVSISYTVGAGETLSDFVIGAESKTPYSLPATGSIYAWGAHVFRSDLGGMVLNLARGDAYYPTTPRNMIGYTEDFSNALWGKANLLAFGSGSISNAIIAPNGLQTADKIVESTANGLHTIDQYYTTTASPYTFSIYLKRAERSFVLVYHGQSNTGIVVNLDTGATTLSAGISAPVASSATSVGDGWYRCSITVNATAASNFFRVYLMPSASVISYTGDGTSGIYLWGAQLSDSASLDAYSPVYGAAVTSAAYYAPRLDYNANGSALGLLVEEQRTNFLQYTAALATSPWSVFSTPTVTNNSATAPDGSNTATRIELDASEASEARQQYSGTVASKTLTFSIWLKSNTGSNQALRLKNTHAAVLDNFTAITVTPEWQRFTLTVTNGSTAGSGQQVAVRNAVAGGTKDVLAWGAQLEEGAFATSYIPNTNVVAGATRTADVASVSTQAFPYSATEGTVVVSATVINTAVNSNRYIGFNLASSQLANRMIDVFKASPQYANYKSSDAQQTGFGVWQDNSKFGVVYKADDYVFVANGGTVVPDTSTSGLSTADTMVIGQLNGSNQLNGHIRQITYIPRRLSNSELQARTV